MIVSRGKQFDDREKVMLTTIQNRKVIIFYYNISFLLQCYFFCLNVDFVVTWMVDLFTLENERFCVLTGPTSKNFGFNYLFRVDHEGKIKHKPK